jgi:competence protein ComEC
LAEGAEMMRACANVDIVIAQEQIFAPCRPRVLRADEPVLFRTGGMALYLAEGRISTVAQGQGQHPWWRAPSGWPEED